MLGKQERQQDLLSPHGRGGWGLDLLSIMQGKQGRLVSLLSESPLLVQRSNHKRKRMGASKKKENSSFDPELDMCPFLLLKEMLLPFHNRGRKA